MVSVLLVDIATPLALFKLFPQALHTFKFPLPELEEELSADCLSQWLVLLSLPVAHPLWLRVVLSLVYQLWML